MGQTEINAMLLLAGSAFSIFVKVASLYVPKFKEWFAARTDAEKQLGMLAVIFAIVFGRFALGCFGQDQTYVCDAGGAWQATVDFVTVALANAGTYISTKYIGEPKEDKEPRPRPGDRED